MFVSLNLRKATSMTTGSFQLRQSSLFAHTLMLCFALCLASVAPSQALPAESVLHTFNAYGDGAYPQARLIQGKDGNYYGATIGGGTNNYGTVFQITPSGQLTTLHSFTGTDGAFPYGNVIEGSDGKLY